MLYVATQGKHGQPPSERSVHFPDGGYAIVRSGWGEQDKAFSDEQYLVFDCGPLGAGNHGHFDCLSFELAAHGRSLIVDPGRYTYSEASEVNWRKTFRGTAYHNTVSVDGKNQTRYEPRVIKEITRHARGSVRHKVTGDAPEHEMRSFVSRPGFDYLHGVAVSHEYDAVHERHDVHRADPRMLALVRAQVDRLHGLLEEREDGGLERRSRSREREHGAVVRRV